MPELCHEPEVRQQKRRRMDGMFLEGIGGEKDVKTATELFMRADAGGSLTPKIFSALMRNFGYSY